MSAPPLSPRPAVAAAASVGALLSTLKQQQHYDYLRAAANPELLKTLAQCAKADKLTTSENIYFADEGQSVMETDTERGRLAS